MPDHFQNETIFQHSPWIILMGFFVDGNGIYVYLKIKNRSNR